MVLIVAELFLLGVDVAVVGFVVVAVDEASVFGGADADGELVAAGTSPSAAKSLLKATPQKLKHNSITLSHFIVDFSMIAGLSSAHAILPSPGHSFSPNRRMLAISLEKRLIHSAMTSPWSDFMNSLHKMALTLLLILN